MATFIKRLNPATCRQYPEKVFVFGDNLLGRGKAGQACVRDEPNAFGIPTKRWPSMTEEAFFSDREDEWEEVKSKLRELYRIKQRGVEIVFPSDGLGTGLAQMEKRSPCIFDEMNRILKDYFYG